jgi:multisubunit Na+/H+ antiporter MnhB subunit
LISAAGIASNLFWGVIALVALRQMRPRSAAARYFLWYFGHATLFMGSGYMVFSALTGLGDVQQAIAGLPLPILWRAGVAVLGIIIYRAALIDAARTLDVWAGNDARAVRLRNLALVPYLALGVAATLSGLLSPDGALAGFFWSAAATFGAGTGFAFLPLMLQDPSTSTHPAALDLERSPGWIAAGGIALIVLYAVLAPGVPR